MAKQLEIGKKIAPYFRQALSYYRSNDADDNSRAERITQAQMASMIGADLGSVSLLVRSNTVKIETVLAIAESCGVPAAVFLRTVADLMEDRPSMVKYWKAGVRYNDNSKPRCYDCDARLFQKSPGVVKLRFSSSHNRLIDVRLCLACAYPVSP